MKWGSPAAGAGCLCVSVSACVCGHAGVCTPVCGTDHRDGSSECSQLLPEHLPTVSFPVTHWETSKMTFLCISELGNRNGVKGLVLSPEGPPLTPGGFLGAPDSHLTPQWAAVTTQSSLMREPPQKWKPVSSWRKMEKSALTGHQQLPAGPPPPCAPSHRQNPPSPAGTPARARSQGQRPPH